MKSSKNEPIMVRVAPELLALLDRWRGKQPNPPTRPEAIRQLIQLGLDAVPQRQKETT
jgi:hypothetical protein